MRPLLASLALLLLALSRPVDSQMDIEQVLSQMPPEQRAALAEKMGDVMTLVFAIMKLMAPELPLPPFMQKPLDNGVLCLYDDPTLEASLKTALYGAIDFHDQEKPLAEQFAGIKCDVTKTDPEWVCFCGRKGPISYCAGLKYKATITSLKEKCKKEALDELKVAAPTLGKAFDFYAMAKLKADSGAISAFQAILTDDAQGIDKIISVNPDATKFFCDAKKPEVETKVKALFASDISFLATDMAIVAGALGQENLQAVMGSCQTDAEFKATPFGKCVCAFDAGILFCAYKTLANSFDQGFLDCAANKFVDAKKPAAPPALKPKAVGAVPTGAPVPGHSADATTGAAAASSLLAPLAAAAAMLLRH